MNSIVCRRYVSNFILTLDLLGITSSSIHELGHIDVEDVVTYFMRYR